ncbi:MAG: hypothetical protein WAR37_04055 [Candidatus Microsaccharimonas sp.]
MATEYSGRPGTVQSVNLLDLSPGTTVTLTTERSKWYITVTNRKRREANGWFVSGLAVATDSEAADMPTRHPQEYSGRANIRLGQEWVLLVKETGQVETGRVTSITVD